jgi:3-oxoacyl-[acyl-carrier-protein] synthase-1
MVEPHVNGATGIDGSAPSRPLPVTGYAMLSALGGTRAEHLRALAAGRSGLGPSPIALPFTTAVGAVHTPLPELPAALAPWSTRLARMTAHLIAQLDEPLRRARARWRPHRIAVLLGTSTAGAESTEQAYRAFLQDGVFPDRYHFLRQHTFGAVLHVVRELTGARGPAWMASTACTSSAKPLASAWRLIAADVIDAAIVGGVDTLCTMTLTGFEALQALDRVPCRPFHKERAGISIGEGGALALVERDGDARVLIEGVGETSDSYHVSAPHPDGLGAAAAMREALHQAGCRPDDVDHVNAHGTGTRLNDSAEAKAIRAVFAHPVKVVSTKGYTGHTLGGAGAIEFAIAACAVEEGWIPPSLHADPIDPEIELAVPTEVVRGRFRRVLSNSFAFGGNNVAVLVGAP